MQDCGNADADVCLNISFQNVMSSVSPMTRLVDVIAALR
jgi:hypothetical protein